MLPRQFNHHGAQQQQRDEVRDGHEAVERVGDIPHERQVRDRTGHDNEAEDDLIGGIGQGQPWPQERTGHDQGHAHHACSTN